MPHENILDPRRTALAVVDVRESFRAHIPDFAGLAARVALASHAAQLLGLTVVVTEQYPKGLGRTVPEVAEHLNGVQPIEKVSFSAGRADGFDDHGRSQALVCGIESHVCVSQTVHDLLDRGLEVHVARDAVTSRTEENREVGIHRMESAGAVVTSVETALFELLGAAGSDEFKAVQGLIR